MEHDVVDTLISPEGQLEVLSKAEVNKLLDTTGSWRVTGPASWETARREAFMRDAATLFRAG